MKTYEKPRLVALSLTSNDMLCGTCGIDGVSEEFDKILENLGLAKENLFDPEISCTVDVEDFEKFDHSILPVLITS